MTVQTEPKQLRARVTRRKLLDAAVEELVEGGYSGLTTTSVAIRAGVSRGAQQNYFPHKHTLVHEAVRHLAVRQIDEIEAAVAAAPHGEQRLTTALDILFAQYSGRLFAAILELSLAGRAEPHLREVVASEERAIARSINGVAATVFGDRSFDPAFDERWASALSAVRGTALLKLLGYPVAVVDRQWNATRTDLIRLLPQPTPGPS